MYGLTRGTTTLLAAGVAGALIWGATKVGTVTVGDYWVVIGMLAAAGLVLALSQLLGGWTKWGWPRVSTAVFLIGFLPALIVGGWIILYSQPAANWFQRHIDSWSRDLGIAGFMHQIGLGSVLVAFGLGLVFGFVFDTTGPRTAVPTRRPTAAPATATPAERPAPSTGGEAPTSVTPADEARTQVGQPAERQPERAQRSS